MIHLLGTLIVIILVTLFAGFNMNSTCNINLLYRTFENVPVFLALIIAFVAGVIVALPYVFLKRHSHKHKEKHAVPPANENVVPSPAVATTPKQKKNFFNFTKNKPATNTADTTATSPVESQNNAADADSLSHKMQ